MISFKIRSLTISLVTFIVVGILFLSNSPKAYASPTDSPVSGGGCTPYSQPQGNANLAFAQYQSCISGGDVFPFLAPSVASDAYFNFSAQNPSLWTDCQVTVSTTDATGNVIDGPYTFNCLNDARVNATGVHYVASPGRNVYVTSGRGYYTAVTWYGTYGGRFYQGLRYFSPEQFV